MGKYQTEVAIQQDRGLILFCIARTVEVSKFLLYGIVHLQKKEKHGRAGEKYKVRNIFKYLCYSSNVHIYLF